MSKTSELYAKHTAEFSKNLDELARVAHAEFPPGTKVTFPHGLKTLRGVIEDRAGYVSTTFKVRTSKGGQFRVDCQHLSLDQS